MIRMGFKFNGIFIFLKILENVKFNVVFIDFDGVFIMCEIFGFEIFDDWEVEFEF